MTFILKKFFTKKLDSVYPLHAETLTYYMCEQVKEDKTLKKPHDIILFK